MITAITAASVLVASHPLNASLLAWCAVKGVAPSKRQARHWLASHPHYGVARAA